MKNFKISIISLFSALGLANLVRGLPEGTTSVQGGGSFTISESGDRMLIEAPDNSIFSHETFNLSSSESVVFSQPNSQARVLNRISSLNPSRIDGKIEANGRLYFLAPGGLIFGEGALIEAGKLHAIAGSLSNEDFSNGSETYTGLSGLVENRGTMIADEVVLGGLQVINSGSIVATEGIVTLGAGGGLELIREDGSFSVSLTNDADAPLGGAGDLAGQALLQSGIVQASEAHLHGTEISQAGSIQADKASFGSFSSLDGSSGALVASQLELLGGSEASPSSVELSSSSNSIGSLKAEGAFSIFNLRSQSSMSVGAVSNRFNQGAGGMPTLRVQQGDIRVTNGNLSLSVGFAPIFTNSASGLLLAASDNLELGSTLPPQNYDRILLYGQNLDTQTHASLSQTENMKLFPLKSTSLDISEISLGLDAESILSLISENPTFDGFSIGDGDALKLSGQEINLVPDDNNPLNLESPAIANPAWADDALEGTKPTFNPLSLSQPYERQSFGTLGVKQLEEAMSLGLFGDFSYYLEAPSSKDFLLASLAQSGGTSSAFGGSFAVVGEKGVGITEKSAEAVESSDSSESSGEESEESADESGDDGDGKSSTNSKASEKLAKARAMGSVPFAPISRPITSPEASLILQEALSVEVERKLEKYLNRKL